MIRIARRSLFAIVLLAAACGGSDLEKGLGYSTTAKQNYDKGLKELKDENFPEALKYFNFVKQKFPFSKYAVLAELRVADTNFDRERYLEAIDQYKMFLRSHPTNEFVEDGYVGFKVCDSYVKQMPDDFVFMPPAFEKDQSPTRDALREIDFFLERWPRSKYVDQARKLRGNAVKNLAESELYVARFYFKRGKDRAAAWRLETMLKLYGGSSLDPEGLLLLGDAYARLKEPAKARDAWSRLIKDFPQAREAKKAQERLGTLPKAQGGDQHG